MGPTRAKGDFIHAGYTLAAPPAPDIPSACERQFIIPRQANLPAIDPDIVPATLRSN